MEVKALKEQIKTGELDKWYIFNVEESATAKVYIRKMADKCNLELSYVDSIYDVFASSSQRALIPINHLYVIINDKDFIKEESAWDAMDRIKDDVVIFYYTNKDGRLKFWKNFQNRAVNFEKLDERLLIKYIQKEIDLSDKYAQILIEVCEGDYSRILLEIDKIKHYQKSTEDAQWDGVERTSTKSCFQTLLKEGTIYKAPKDALFDFTNAVLERDAVKAWDLLNQSYSVGEASLVLLSVLYDNVKHLLQLQSAKGKSGLNGWIAKNLSPYKGNYSNGELIHAMHMIKEASDGIKTGRIADDISVEQILVRIM